MKNVIRTLTLALAAIVATPVVQGAVENETKTTLTRMEEEIRRELVMLPWFSVFDNMQFKVEGNHVILSGQVIRPTLKSSAERVVSRIEGVERITNNIEVLPLSPFDNDIRLAAYRMIYGYGPLQRYAMNPQGPIRIIVKNGNITLEGVVATEMDRTLANMRANQVPGAFTVTNDLRVEG